MDNNHEIKIKSGNKDGSISNIINLIEDNLLKYSKCELIADNDLSSKLTSVIEIIKRKLGISNIIIKYNLITSTHYNTDTKYSLCASIELINKNIDLSILYEDACLKIKKTKNDNNKVEEDLNKNIDLFY